MVLKKETIPPQIGVSQKLGHYACLENGQILVPSSSVPFSASTVGQSPRRALVNNFDAAVSYSHAAVADVITNLLSYRVAIAALYLRSRQSLRQKLQTHGLIM